jgi:hypothetical protein
MQKAIIISCITGSLLIILGQFGFFEGLMVFIIAGAIPGTSYSIPSNIMYGILLAAISLTIIWLVGIPLFDRLSQNRQNIDPTHKQHHKRLPKRRFGQI